MSPSRALIALCLLFAICGSGAALADYAETYRAGVGALQQKRYDEAGKLLETAAQGAGSAEERFEALRHLAAAHEARGQAEAARRVWERMLDIEKLGADQRAYALFAIAASHRAEQNHESADEAWRRALDLPDASDDTKAQALVSLAQRRREVRDFVAARELYQRVDNLKQVGPQMRTSVRIALATVHMEEKSWDEARKILAAVRDNAEVPASTRSHAQLLTIVTYNTQGQPEGLREACERLLAMEGAPAQDKTQAYVLLGQVLADKGDIEGARKAYAGLLAMPDAAESYRELARQQLEKLGQGGAAAPSPPPGGAATQPAPAAAPAPEAPPTPVAAPEAQATPPAAAPKVDFQIPAATALQLLRNGGFEEDQTTFRGEPTSSCGGHSADQWYNQQDLFPDGWQWPGVCFPHPYGNAKTDAWPRPEVTLDRAVSRSGSASLRLSGKAVTVEQPIEWHHLKDVYKDIAGATRFEHSERLTEIPALHQNMILSGWVRRSGVPANARTVVALSLEPLGGQALAQSRLELEPGDGDWQRFELPLSAAQQVEGVTQQDPKAQLLQVRLSYTSASGAGQVWFDDLTLLRAPTPSPNLLPNGSFEASVPGKAAPAPVGPASDVRGAIPPAAEAPYPAGWSQPRKWHYQPPPTYYIWNNWNHFYAPTRSAPVLDTLVARTGKVSLRLEFLPGDEYFIESSAIALHQTEARPIECAVWVRADRLKHLDLMMVDDQGRRLLTSPTLTYWGGRMSGTHGWVALRKVFQALEPVRSVRVRIAGRGFNGQTETDIGQWHWANQVSTVWLDDIAVREVGGDDLATRGVKPAAEPGVPAESPEVTLSDLDLGERLFGRNHVTATIHNASAKPAKARLEVTLTTPSGQAQPVQRSAEVTVEPGNRAAVRVPYDLTELATSLEQQGSLQLALTVDGKPVAKEAYRFGTWPGVANVRPSKAFLDETENPILAAVNLGVAAATLAEVAHLDLEVIERASGKSIVRTQIGDIPAAIARAQIKPASEDRFYFYVPRAGLLDHRNLILRELDVSSLTPRPWDDPEAEWALRLTAVGRDGDVMFTTMSHPFGRLTKMEETLEPIREVTIDERGHFFRVNGEPFFPFAHSHANGAANGGAPLSRSVAFFPDRAKVNGMNGLNRWSWVTSNQEAWEKARVYAPMLWSGYSPYIQKDPSFLADRLKDLQQGQVLMAKHAAEHQLHPLTDVNESPWLLAYCFTMDEAIFEFGRNEQHKRAELAYADALAKKINRPVGVMDNHSLFYPWHSDDAYLDHFQVLYFEREAGSIDRPQLTLRRFLERKKGWAMLDLPQCYENVPHRRERYRALLAMMHGTRGWFGIQGAADPSLYRGMGGEMRYMFRYLSANEPAPEVEAPEGVTVKAWRKGERLLVMAEQHNPIPHGVWEWKEIAGKRAHTGHSTHPVTPVKAGYAIHGYNDDLYRLARNGDVFEQEIYLEPEHTPAAVFLIVPGDGDFNHVAYWGEFDHAAFVAAGVDRFLAGECWSHAGYGINMDRVIAEGLPAYQAAHRFPATAFVRIGDLPPAGRWATLKVPLEKLGLDSRAVDGLMYMARDGTAWWGRSTLKPASGRTHVLLDGRIGRDPDAYLGATLAVAGLGDGAVRVVGENRELPMRGGRWTDDLRGEDLFGKFRWGYMGDGINYGQPMDKIPAELVLGYTYDDSPRCLRVYEVIPER